MFYIEGIHKRFVNIGLRNKKVRFKNCVIFSVADTYNIFLTLVNLGL